ncbi:deleted in lung and esophageal cancer protein 1-like [Mirounga angustirostris]|uniref:deleted in lung and esophageal cancer protein 1-like n=1 Tax=Mirounga angustirostris TaxID=9716 RepID=UPI00313AF14B
MVFTQNLLLEYANQTAQVVPLRATVAVPELQLSTSWVDFGTCFVNQGQVREVDLMNLSGCRSYWAVLTGRLYLPTTSPAGWHHLGVPADGRFPDPK